MLLQLYVDSKRVAHAIYPLTRPNEGEAETPKGKWLEAKPLDPEDATQSGWPEEVKGSKKPVIMVGCHRTSADEGFRDFSQSEATFDEIAVWTRRLEINRTHEETLYFTGGYCKELRIVISLVI